MQTRTSGPELRLATARESRSEWWRLGLFLVALLLGLAALRWEGYRALGASERERLGSQLLAMDNDLSRQMQGIHAALLSIRRQAAAGSNGGALNPELEALAAAMPMVRTLNVLRADGGVQQSSRAELMAQNFAGRAYFQTTRDRNDPAVLHLSPPFRNVLGVYSLNLSVSWQDAQGRFAGAVAATLDPDHLRPMLEAAVYAPDMWASLIHGQGVVLMSQPRRQESEALDVGRPGTLFSRHRAEAAVTSVFSGAVLSAPDARLLGLRTVQAPGLPLDQPLVIALSRDLRAVYAPWRDVTLAYALFYALLAGGPRWGCAPCRRAAMQALSEQADLREIEDAERLEMALRGADLGLWDLRLDTGVTVVNERWAQMLGETLADVQGPDAWRERVHPEDYPRVAELQQRHVDGETPAFEAVYRMRHRAGHWLWILDRGRVTERDAQGRALRIAGTHMDITERTQVQQALARSEQALAVTLHSIGDAVIATDAQGCITRVNAAAERLTGWPASDAVGQPLRVVFRIFSAETGEPARDPVQQVLAHGQTVGLANGTRLLARDGSAYQIADSAAPIRTPEGEVLGVVLVFSDVTAQYAAQQALQDRERQLTAMAEALPGPVSRVDEHGRYLFASSAYERWFGQPVAAILGRTQRELLGQRYERVEAHVQRALTGETVHYETPVASPLGELFALITLVPDRDETGRVRGHFTIVTDITERKRAEDALRSSERQSRALLDVLTAGVVLHAADTRILDSNPAASRILGLTHAQLQGRQAIDPAWQFIEADGSPLPLARFPVNLVLNSGEALQDMVLGVSRPDLPQPVWVLVSAMPMHGHDGAVEQVVVTFADVSARVRAEAQLRLLEASVARLNDIVLITEVDADPSAPPRIVYVNDAFERVTGYARAEVMGRSPGFLQGPQSDPAEAARLRSAVMNRMPVHAEILNYDRQQRTYWVEIDIVPLADRGGRVTHMVAVQRDVTERRQAQARLQAAQDELAATLAAVPDLLFKISLDGHILDYHSPRQELLYIAADAQIGRTVAEVLPAHAARQVMQAIAEAHTSGFSGGRRYALDLPQGLHWFEISVAPKAVAPGSEPHFIMLARDITDRQHAETERRALEAQLRESQKMEAIGTLAGGIAHDFNNIIAGILGNAALARQDVGAEHPAAGNLAQIERAGLRARTLVRQIMAFSRREALQPVNLSLRAVVEESLALLRATLPAGVRLEADLGPAPAWVLGDATQLQQVMMNLCVNAWQALPEDGGQLQIGLQANGTSVCFSVRDNGCGMDEATLARIFDPFFTTKAAGRGTGLGLAVVHGIVQAHQGRITVDSQPGVGTEFRVLLPQVAGEQVAAAAVAPDPAATPGRGQHILYVDDDAILRQVVPRLLERAGWRVSDCATAGDALALLAEPDSGVALLVTDMNMPDVNGLDLCAQARRQWPTLPLLITSGHVTEDLVARSRQAGVVQVLPKENLLDDLVLAVAAALPPATGR